MKETQRTEFMRNLSMGNGNPLQTPPSKVLFGPENPLPAGKKHFPCPPILTVQRTHSGPFDQKKAPLRRLFL